MTPDEAKLYDLVAEWDERRTAGGEISPEQLCSDCPELLKPLKKRIVSTRATDWLLNETIAGPSKEATEIPTGEPLLVPDFWSMESLIDAISNSGLMTREELESLNRRFAFPAPDGLAQTILQEGHLTQFQLQSILQPDSQPLFLGNYILLDILGAGGMGTVYRARHRLMKRQVALKTLTLPPDAPHSPPLIEDRFRQELEAAARLRHPNIVTAFDADEAGGQHFLVMEYIEGSDLAKIVKTEGPLSIERALDYMIQATEGLEYAHEQGIIHRDVKPHNLLLNDRGEVKILDLGLASIERDGSRGADLTTTGMVKGTVDFMAPEQALRMKNADARSDIYSLGMSLWYLLTGRPAYEEESLVARLLAHREVPIPSLGCARPHIPEGLEEIYQKMVAKKPEERYQTMAAAREDLERILHRTTENDANKDSVISGLSTKPFEREGEILEARPVIKPSNGSKALLTGGQDAATSYSGNRRKVSRSWIVGGGFVAFSLLLGVIIRIVDEDGTTSEVRVPENARVEIVQEAEEGPVSTAPQGPQLPNWALEFDGNDLVSVPSLKYEDQDEVTIECFINAQDRRFGADVLVFPPVSIFVQFFERGRFVPGIFLNDHRRAPQNKAKWNGTLSRERVHIAGVVEPQIMKLFVDGELVAEQSSPVRDADKLMGNDKKIVRHLTIGGRLREGGSMGWCHRGTVDEIRISDTARYHHNFKPRQRFTPDEHTLALYHCDEGSGKVLKDSSGNGYDGKIVGAKWFRLTDPAKTEPQANTE